MQLIKLTPAQRQRAAHIYHPGTLYNALGWHEAQQLVGGGLGIRYMCVDPTHASTMADYTPQEAALILNGKEPVPQRHQAYAKLTTPDGPIDITWDELIALLAAKDLVEPQQVFECMHSNAAKGWETLKAKLNLLQEKL